MKRELFEANRRVQALSRSAQINAVKMETSNYFGFEKDRLLLNRWFCEVDIAIDSWLIESPASKVSFLLLRLSKKAKELALEKLVVAPKAFSTLTSIPNDLRLALELR